jgi:A/G-specific adenine glycosylase
MKQRSKEKNAAPLKQFFKPAAATSSATAASSSDAIAAPASPSSSSTAIIASHSVSAYGIWVSEMMLQQTRVETVIEYWTRWMVRFPTVRELARATVDEVNSMWAGLGYYRRARFLLHGAQTIVEKHGGVMPNTVDGLLSIPGIGPYTAGAIASIAFKVPTPLVDGNVIRVLARLRAIDVDPKNRAAQAIMWQLASRIVDPLRAGDFNQALMELGATICTPLNPQCAVCPVRSACYAYREVQQRKRPCDLTADELTTDSSAAAAAPNSPIVIDIEELPPTSSAPTSGTSSSKSKSKSKLPVDVFARPADPCIICDPRDTPPTAVTCYPSKAIKKAPLEQHVAVTVLKRAAPAGTAADLFLLVKRPEEGLLAGQWEFPSLIVPHDATPAMRRAKLINFLRVQFDAPVATLDAALSESTKLGELVHVFSHRKHLMDIDTTTIRIDQFTHTAADRALDELKEDRPPIKKPRVDANKKVSRGGSTKAKNDDEEAESPDEDDTEDVPADVPSMPQSYRWVTLGTLQENHKSTGGSALGLSTGVRKIVQLIATATTSGGGAKKVSSVKSSRVRTPSTRSAAAVLEGDAVEETGAKQVIIDLAAEADDADVCMESDESATPSRTSPIARTPSSTIRRQSTAGAADSSSTSTSPRQSGHTIVPAKAVKLQRSLRSFFGGPAPRAQTVE